MYETLSSTMRVLKDLAYTDCGNLKKFYDYKVSNMKEQAGDAVDVREEYVTGLMDPSREAALVEKQNVIRKNIGKKKLWQLKAVRVPVFKKATSKLEAKNFY